ncbi:MAG: hypothetical protein ACYC7L_02980 [Nitrospirota bacterium]
MKTWANILLGIWLVLTGLIRLGGVSFPKSGTVLIVLGIVTGILIIVANSSEKISTQIGGILLGTWLVAGGLMVLFNIHFSGSGVILAVLGVAAGVMVLIARR